MMREWWAARARWQKVVAVIVALWVIGTLALIPFLGDRAVPNETSASRVHVFTIASAGGTATAITPGSSPVWSPDGERIAFTDTDDQGQEGVYVITANTGSTGEFLTPGSDPMWSPDGERIAFTDTDDQGQEGVYVITATVDSTGEWLAFGSVPTWSPSGDRLAFAALQ